MIANLKAWLSAMLVVVAAPSALAVPATKTGCFSDWATAAAVVVEEKLLSVETLSRQFRQQKLGEIVKTELCKEDGGYVYRLVVRGAKGRFRSTIYDARRGIEIGVAETGR